MKIRLDARTISALELPAGKTEDFAWDSELAGFGLRLRRRTSGDLQRTFIAQYRADGHTRRATIGEVDKKITTAQARDAARKLLARVELGGDPQGEKAAKKRSELHVFRTTVEDYLAAQKDDLRPASRRINKLYLTGPYFRTLHPKAVTTVTRADVATAVRDIVRKHSALTAAAARRALSAFFAWAIADGLMGDGMNPVDGSYRPDDPEARDRVLSDGELVAIWNACDGTSDFDKIVRLLILGGHRRQEVGGMTWGELDLDAGVWTLPAERSKNHRTHKITLSEAMLGIIKSVPRTNRDHLFGSRASTGFTGWATAKAQLDRRLAGIVGQWRLHDLRRTTATKMADLGVEPHHIEAALNHFGGFRRGVGGVYNRSNSDRSTSRAEGESDVSSKCTQKSTLTHNAILLPQSTQISDHVIPPNRMSP